MRVTDGKSGALVSALAATLILASSPSMSAVVRSDPTPVPAPIPGKEGLRTEVPWAGVAMTFPAEWDVRPKQSPGPIHAGATVLAAFGPGDESCLLDLFDPRYVDDWEDVGVDAATVLTLAGVPARRYDSMWGGGLTGVSSYTLYAPTVQYSLLCTAPVAPGDRWLSIAETIELLADQTVEFASEAS